ncbi:MAG: hypothetical protein ACOX32_00955 [Bacteroidaceae bacterium]|jgi:hypothetical protein|nr:hypothetical protein [Bacteroidaceae bacterium]HOD68202.1 hypothetical protein [Bacteroidaceae bacterium]HQL26088.1 hypothetical protein [Bacteroidaceae bacterium]
MNRIVFLFIITFLLSGCEKERNTSFELVKTLINKTDNQLLYSIKTNVRADSVVSFGNDSLSMKFVKNGTVFLPPIGPYSIDIESVRIESEVLYNITDTSYFQFNFYRDECDDKNSLYKEMIFYGVDGNIFNERHTEKLFFTDTLIPIMTKDYTMLEKFSEYYSKQ